MTTWIKCSDRLPENYRMVLVFNPDADVRLAVGSWEKTYWWVIGGFSLPTHWSELPDPPKEDE